MKFVDIHTHGAINAEIIQINDFSQIPKNELDTIAFYSLGIHPWIVKSNSLHEDLDKIENSIIDKKFLAIGECGLDKVCGTDFLVQMEAFKKQISLSEKYKKPLIIHSVKAFSELIQTRQKSKAKQPWIIHGFNGSPQLAKQLIDLGIFLSFGHHLNISSSKASKTILHIPSKFIFLETDNSKLEIEEIYHYASKHINVGLDELRRQVYMNFQSLFLHDF